MNSGRLAAGANSSTLQIYFRVLLKYHFHILVLILSYLSVNMRGHFFESVFG